ncbi:MAG: hypothetical protein F4Y44_08930 [Chloroflexi bacterium]|nr:hypothetical protein [Chloroflexota bacterium]
MTTEAQPQIQQEQPDDSNNIWRVLGRLEANQQTMLQILERHDENLRRHDANIVDLSEKITSLEASQQAMLDRMDRQDNRMDRLEAKMDRLLYVFIGVGVTIVVTMLGAMAAGFWAVLAALAN